MIYNLGRILTYGALGAVIAAFGALAGLTSYQSVLSAGLGLTLIVLGASGIQFVRIPVVTPILNRFTTWLKLMFGKLIQSRRLGGFFLMGVLNGVLPCGLIYFALAYCVILPNAWLGFIFMILFGLGTVPVMVGIPAILNFVSGKLRRNFRHTTAVVMIALGSLLLIRSAWVHPEKAVTDLPTGEVVCP